MKIQATRNEFLPTWVKRDLLEELWVRNPNYYVKSWSGEPDAGWFSYSMSEDKTGFCTGDMYFEKVDGQLTIGFENGRHRTRWLMSLGETLIPVGLEDHHYKKALSIGLAVSRVMPDERLNA